MDFKEKKAIEYKHGQCFDKRNFELLYEPQNCGPIQQQKFVREFPPGVKIHLVAL